MKPVPHVTLQSLLLASLLVVGYLAGGGVVWAQAGKGEPAASAVAATVVPPIPLAPHNLAFQSELAGRRSLFALHDSLKTARYIGYTAQITRLSSDRPGTARPVETAVETGRAELPQNRLALVTERQRGQRRQIERAIANLNTVLVARYEDTAGKNPPTRTAARAAVDALMPLGRALASLSYEPATIAAEMLLEKDPPQMRFSSLWQQSQGREGEVLVEIEPSHQANRSRTVARTRRYTLDPDTRRLRRFEEWTLVQDPPRAGRDGKSIAYRREDYTWSFPAQPFAASNYAQTLPESYQEKPVNSRIRPLDPPPAKADPKALTLLERWRKAQSRWLTYSTRVEQTIRRTPRTAASRPIAPELQLSQAVYSIQTRRHGMTRLTLDWIRGEGRRGPEHALFVSDGKELHALDRASNRVRNRSLRDPDDLWRELNRGGFRDQGDLDWIYTGVPDPEDYDSITYGGQVTDAEGETVEVILLAERDTERNRRRGRTYESTEVTRVGLGSDGLPRWIERIEKTDISGLFERDNPPITTTLTRFRSVSVDSEPSRTAFAPPVLPANRS